ncbi:MAG: replicative DNA helicase [Synergistaceae bacterium]|nr:replicative DNA helicase [Synergistaceae bacterium]
MSREKIAANFLAERAVLGACLFSREKLADLSKILSPDDFYDMNNRIAYEIMLDMLEKDMPIDLVTFLEEAKKRGQYERLGGQPFVAELMMDISVIANTRYHANIMLEYSARRKLYDAGRVMSYHSADTGREVADLIAEAEGAISAISREEEKEPSPVKDALEAAYARIADTFQNGISKDAYFSSGLTDLDNIIIGFQPGSLNIIAARPSMGKTALALNIAQFGGNQTAPVLVFSLEMTAEQLAYRMIASEGALTLSELQTGTFGSLYDLQETVNALRERQIFISDNSTLSATDFRSECRRFKQKHPDLALIVVDYLQLMSATRRENRQYEITEISRMLKAVAVELKVPVIALSQLSRETEKRVEKKPQLSDLRDSGAIEQDADVVLLLYREDYYSGESSAMDSKADIRIAKNRNGETGACKLTFRREYARFVSYGEE